MLRLVFVILLSFALLPATAQKWQVVGRAGTQEIIGITFPTPEVGYAINNYELWKTVDGGKTWQMNFRSENGVIISLHFIDERRGWLCGGILPPGYVMRTADGGQTWQTQKGKVMQMYSCWFTDTRTGWAVANDGTTGYHYRYSTKNGGRSWQLIDTAFDYLRYVSFFDENHGWILGDNSHMFRTTNGGRKWKKYTIEGVHHFSYMEAITTQNLWAVEPFTAGLTYRSADGGRHWDMVKVHPTLPANCLHFTTLDSGWAAGNDGMIVETNNGGQTWIPCKSPTTEKLNAMSFPTNSCGYIGGSKGVVLKWGK